MLGRKNPNHPHPRSSPPSPLPRDRSIADARAHARASSELWLEVYTAALDAFLHDLDRRTKESISQCVDDARLAADLAVDEYDKRWAGVAV